MFLSQATSAHSENQRIALAAAALLNLFFNGLAHATARDNTCGSE